MNQICTRIHESTVNHKTTHPLASLYASTSMVNHTSAHPAVSRLLARIASLSVGMSHASLPILCHAAPAARGLPVTPFPSP
mmetsp:Transcript_2628/g.5944  ORF Transcript_2628/g.5944 Transcript_2628/m.5944 type:complete len:81 (-) Transcript_2628:125-367(-)